MGVNRNCTCRPRATKTIKVKKGQKSTVYVSLKSRAVAKFCLAMCMGLAYEGKPVRVSGLPPLCPARGSGASR